MKGLPVDQKILDGQISIASVSCTGRFELLGITTSSTMSKRLSLSALLGKAVSVARQHEKQVIVDFETSCATFKLDLIDEEAPSTTGKHFHKSDELFLTDAFTHYNRRVTSRLHVKGPAYFGK
ncbi:hypothetical protein PHMEG_00032607 [Phytophthora megakarya]|uniref:Uncharacterized protein n=1 Tax=Phytophthora megakarya TaxID=4795 RepID=A0A225UW14_9STRA|nr:hypothetical protein PHMEG_00032607 [Phytophthora megakarya]